MKDIIIDTLLIEEDRPMHIAKHGVTIDEVLEILTGDYVYIAGRAKCWLLIGQTVQKRFLTVVLGERPQQNTYGLVTTRPTRSKERSLYNEYVLQRGGEKAA